VGLGAGDDRLHVIGRIRYGRGRPSPNLLPWRQYLPSCARRHGVYNRQMARACRRAISTGHWRGIRYAGADRGGAPVFDHATALDLLIEDLHGHECRYLIAARIFDYVRQTLGEHGHLNLFGLEITTYRTLFLVSLGFELLLFPTIYFLRRGAEATDEGVKFDAEPVRYATAAFWERVALTVSDSALDTVRLFRRLLSQSGFYRLLAFLLLIGFLKLIFLQMDYVFPKFGIRELGDGAPIGQLSAINYLLIIVLVPMIGALTQQFSAYRMVVVGGAICAASVFIMALPTTWFDGLARGGIGQWLGHSYLGLKGGIHPYYIMIALYIAIFSVGEAFYSPRVYEYAAAIAPRGQEASYGALSYIPFLIGKLLVGTGGWLLAAFCPEHGPRHSWVMWLIFALAASVAPIGLMTFRRYIRVPEAGRQDID
jgi:hypothetical protein